MTTLVWRKPKLFMPLDGKGFLEAVSEKDLAMLINRARARPDSKTFSALCELQLHRAKAKEAK